MNLWSVTCNQATIRKIRVVLVTYLRIRSGKQLHPMYPLCAKEAVTVF
jgi:hypothetical protein